MSVMRSIPLFSIAARACYSVGVEAVGGLPNLSAWSQLAATERHRRVTSRRPSEIPALPGCCRSGAVYHHRPPNAPNRRLIRRHNKLSVTAQPRRRPASFGWPRLSMDAQTAREEAEWPPDLSSGDLRAWRCDTDCLGDDRLEVRERSPHLVVRFQSCSGVTDGTLRFDENRRLSEIASKTTRRPT